MKLETCTSVQLAPPAGLSLLSCTYLVLKIFNDGDDTLLTHILSAGGAVPDHQIYRLCVY